MAGGPTGNLTGQPTDGSPTGPDSVEVLFENIVSGLDTKHLDIPEKLLALPSTGQNSGGQEKKKKNLTKLMAYAFSIAFFAYSKPDDLYAHFPLGLTETLTDGTTVQHFNEGAMEDCLEGIVRIRLKTAEIARTQGSVNTLSKKVVPYLVFTHGTSMVECDVLEDLLTTKETPSHYLCIRKKSNAVKSNVEVNVELNAKDPMADGASAAQCHITLDFSSTKPVVSSAKTSVNTTLLGKQVKVTYSVDVLTVAAFVEDSKNPLTRLWLDDYVIGVPRDPTADWKPLFNNEGITPKPMYPVAYIDAHSTATQAWLFWNKQENVLVLAFPGTDIYGEFEQDSGTSRLGKSVKLGDITASPKFTLNWTSSASDDDDAQVHEGYKEAYLSVRDALLETMHSITGWNDDWSIIVTGHSLGGSLATLATFDIAKREKEVGTGPKKPVLAMFTFAAPAVANQSLANQFLDSVTCGFRVVAEDDRVAETMYWPFYRLGNETPWDNTKRPPTDPNDAKPATDGQSCNNDTQPTLIWDDVLTLSLADRSRHTFSNYLAFIQSEITK